MALQILSGIVIFEHIFLWYLFYSGCIMVVILHGIGMLKQPYINSKFGVKVPSDSRCQKFIEVQLLSLM
jgi:hypothetical protein